MQPSREAAVWIFDDKNTQSGRRARTVRAPAAWIADAQARGLATLVFTVNEPERMRELAELGVTGIFTDRPGLLRRTLAAR